MLRDHVAAISCGIYNGTPVLDLDYAEDSEADTDANFVMTGDGGIVEVQGTAEKTPFSRGRVPGADGAGAQGHRPAGRSAEDGGGVMRRADSSHGVRMHRQITGTARDRDPQSRQARRDARAAGALRHRCGLGRRARPAEPDETGTTFQRQCADQGPGRGHAAAQLPAFADDSGLVVDALDGAPGIYSARWAGPDKDFARR